MKFTIWLSTTTITTTINKTVLHWESLWDQNGLRCPSNLLWCIYKHAYSLNPHMQTASGNCTIQVQMCWQISDGEHKPHQILAVSSILA